MSGGPDRVSCGMRRRCGATTDGRLFDTIESQLAKNGDGSKRIVLKIDVEGAEWASFLAAPDELLQRIDQMSVEFHWLRDDQSQWIETLRYRLVIQRSEAVLRGRACPLQQRGLRGGSRTVPDLGLRGALREQASRRGRCLPQRQRPASVRCAQRPVGRGLPAGGPVGSRAVRQRQLVQVARAGSRALVRLMPPSRLAVPRPPAFQARVVGDRRDLRTPQARRAPLQREPSAGPADQARRQRIHHRRPTLTMRVANWQSAPSKCGHWCVAHVADNRNTSVGSSAPPSPARPASPSPAPSGRAPSAAVRTGAAARVDPWPGWTTQGYSVTVEGGT